MNEFVNKLNSIPLAVTNWFKTYLGKISAQTLGWLAIILIHFASIPTLLAVLLGQTDKMPPVDLVIFIWASLLALFFKSLIEKNFLYVATICVGFSAQTIMMSLILFK